jgi:hypothetical protein
MDDAVRLGNDEGLTDRKELRAFLEYPNPTDFENEVNHFKKTRIVGAGYYGLVLEGTYHGVPCVAKVVNISHHKQLINTLQELLIQTILFEALQAAPPTRDYKVKIPEIATVFRSTAHMHNLQVLSTTHHVELDTSSIQPVVVIVMERVETDLMKVCHAPTMTVNERSRICTIALLEIINTFKYFNNTLGLNFMHADLKSNNVMMNADPSAPGGYQIYMIDFGMSSLDYKGVRIGAGQIFETVRFANPGYHNHLSDIVYLVWSMWKFQGCDMSLRTPCPRYTELFDKVLRIILLFSGIPFRTERRFDSISHQTFRSMLTAGHRITRDQFNYERVAKSDALNAMVREIVRTSGVTPEEARKQVDEYISPRFAFQYESNEFAYPITLDELLNLVKAYARSQDGSTEERRKQGRDIINAFRFPE